MRNNNHYRKIWVEEDVGIGAVHNIIHSLTDRSQKFAEEILQKLKEQNIRAELDDRTESIGKKIREAKVMRIPYFIIIGDKDIEISKVTLESRDHGQIGQLSEDEVVERMVKEIVERR